MSLAPGTRFGVYEVSVQIGEGGMGQVYRARDTKLDRDVAIKILPEAFSHDADRLARFQREAKTLASLNHPHIAGIHGLEESGGITALVMEFVEGEDLSQRIARLRAPGASAGQAGMPLDEAIPIAKQIAEALEAAHDQGIIHRDLKPANIKVRPDGTAKVLDFGLAKAVEGVAGAGRPGVTQSPTITSPAMTHAGMILGTAAYMAPEQARGRILDRRADIWAFGCVLFEMLSGRRAFPGDDVTDTLAAVVRGEPDWAQLPQELSPALLAFLKRSLQKDPKQRLGDIRDFRFALDGAFDVTAPAAAPPPASRSRATRLAWLSFAVAAIGAVALAIPAVRHLLEVPSNEPSLRLSIALPRDNQVGFLELSPDGKRLAAVLFHEGRYRLYLRALDAADWQVLPGTESARVPFWSPDSRSIGFFSDGALKVIPAAGGPASVLCSETGLGSGGTWNPNGVILFATERGQLRRVNAAGGPCTPVGTDDRTTARLPVFLPDGRHFLFLQQQGDASSRGVYLAALDDLTPRKVLADVSSVIYAPPAAGGSAHLLFLRDYAIMMQPFDDATLSTVGDPFPLVSQATVSFTPPQMAASLSGRTLIYVAGFSRDSQLTWFDRSGKAVGTVGERAEHQNVALSPDGNALLSNRREASGPPALWLHDLVRGSENRFLPSGTAFSTAVWSPDSREALFRMNAANPEFGLYQKDGNGAGQPVLLSSVPDGSFAPSAISPDGRFLVYTLIDPKTQADIWYVRWDDRRDLRKAVKFAATAAVESQGQVSPDGKWLAYVSNETSVFEVYVRPFPDGAGVWKISVNGGREPRWSADGKRITFARSTNNDQQVLLSADISADGRDGLRAGTPQRLFDYPAMGIVPQSNVFSYSPHPDGQRFLVNALPENRETTINVITNWQKTIANRTTP